MTIWDSKSGAKLGEYAPGWLWTYSLSLNHDESLLLSRGAGSLRIGDVAQGVLLHQIDFDHLLQKAHWHPTQSMILVSKDNKVQVLNPRDLAVVRTFVNPAGPITDFAVSPDGAIVVVGSPDGDLIGWEIETGREVLHQLPGLKASRINQVAFTDDGQTLVSRDNHQIRFWRQTPPSN